MNRLTVYLLIAVLIAMTAPLVFAQQNQNTPGQEIESLKKQISEIQSKLQTVENVEKMELAAKLAEANAKLANAEFDKFERQLRDSNDEWLRTWSTWFLAIIAIIVTFFSAAAAGVWARFKSKMDQLIADRVEESLNGFKEAVAQLDEIRNQLKVLHRGHAVSVLDRFERYELEHYDPFSRKQTDVLSDEVLLDVFNDESKRLEHRYKAARVLSGRNFPHLVSLLLNFVNSVLDTDDYVDGDSDFRDFVYLIGESYTQDAYQGLKKFLNRLQVENPKCKDLFQTYTVFALADVSIKLELSDSTSMLKQTLPDLVGVQREPNSLSRLAKYFDIFGEPDSIKEILEKHVTNKMNAVERNCLKFLNNHDPEYVNKWNADKAEGKLEYQKSS
ncbi:MAG: hypothetical protein OXU23_25500 [Candidatus Poribacteria bacterium]|nr:hypothetical protein [Candidatus Poribacteria bacterium]